MYYKGFRVQPFSTLQKSELEEVGTDEINWREYYKIANTNWIKFYPFSEYQGGGEPFMIEIKNFGFEEWIECYRGFEVEVRALLTEERRNQ